ncbi:MAG: hypothetical protein Q7R82_02790 [Candidatus Daviesbacteria bacterium]|nr:hypothetical protein [Candidatus Daviesbacteria bacterium]
MSPELLAVLSIQTEGLTLYKAGICGETGYPQNFSRDTLEAGMMADDPEMVGDQLTFSNLHQAKRPNPRNGAEPFKYHHQLPGVVVHRGLSTEYNASDVNALVLLGHAYYQRRTGDKSLTERFRSNLRGAIEKYIFSHINPWTHQFEEHPKLSGADDFGLDRTDWKDSKTPGRVDGKVIYPVVYPNLQAIYMGGLRAGSFLFGTKEFANEALKMRKGLQSLFNNKLGSFHIAVDKLGPIQGISSDGLNMFAYLDIEDLEPWQWEAVVKASTVLETVAGYQNIDPEIAKTMDDDYHARVWPKEVATILRGAYRLQQRAKEEGLPHLVDAFGHVMEVSLRIDKYLDTNPETLKVHGNIVEKAGCDPQLWTVTAKQCFRRYVYPATKAA